MTYAGLKSFLYAGIGKDDKRVKAAVEWIKKNYTVTGNPGMKEKESGLFYYYHTFAKAMDALGDDIFVDAKGVKHDWRQELFDELKGKQKANGAAGRTSPTAAFLETSAGTGNGLRAAGAELLQEEVGGVGCGFRLPLRSVRGGRAVAQRRW